ncbi:MAG TPA: GNAT family N-acetyltransferase [Kineosporiaceae bacterium]|nr:GNAT family N-acetyltransferase [Kineosporiaceae bacterium]
MPPIEIVTFERSSDLFPAWFRTRGFVYFQPRPDDERVELFRKHMTAGRFVAAVDDGTVVGTYRSWTTHVTAPGGATVAADAVSSVAVLPTHRRRGLLTRMITEDLGLAVEQGLPLAVLIAAEAPIYGRYGFGAATETARWVVDARTARIAASARRSAGTVRLVDEGELRGLAPAVHELARRPGEIDRPAAWWDRDFGFVLAEPSRVPRSAAVHVAPDGTVDGFVTFRAEDVWHDRVYDSVLHVEMFRAASDDAYAGLWSLLLDVDTVARVEAEELAVDEPLPWFLTDPRAARQVSRVDFQWSRLLDPAAVLSARGYEAPGAVVVEVVDPAGWAAGTYLLEADASGAGSCTRTSRSAELTLGVGVLSCAWLGSNTLPAASAAGLVDEHVPGALGRLARLLVTSRAPWTQTWF